MKRDEVEALRRTCDPEARASAAPRRRVIGSATFLLLVLLSPALPADWVAQTLDDPTRDEESRGVAQQNERGFRFEIVRGAEGEVLAVFRVAPGAGDFLDSLHAPTLQIDGGPRIEVAVRETGLTWVAFPVWNGDGQALTGPLRDLMSGSRVDLVYFLDGGGYKETGFDLAGARQAISEAFGVPADVDPAEVARARDLESALLEEGARCTRLKGKKRQECIDRVKACAAQAASSAELRACAGS